MLEKQFRKAVFFFVSDLLSLPRSFTFNPIGRQTLAV